MMMIASVPRPRLDSARGMTASFGKSIVAPAISEERELAGIGEMESGNAVVVGEWSAQMSVRVKSARLRFDVGNFMFSVCW